MERRVVALALAASVIAGSFALVASSPRDAAVVLALLAVASAAYAALVVAIGGRDAPPLRGRELAALVAIGLLARVVLAPVPAVLEDDVNRYLWDGAVLADGHSPYAYSPQQVYDARLERPLEPLSAEQQAELAVLAALSRSPALDPVFLRINYPSVPTIYPPMAQLLFASLAVVSPGSLLLMKVALIALDAATALALLAILLSLGAPRRFVLLYWLNPLIVLSFAGSAHMDALPMALLTGAIALVLRGRALASGALLGIAASAKLFPIVCWPALARRLGVRGTVLAGAMTGLAYALLWHPRMFEGLATFATLWQINGALHPVLAALAGGSAARIIAALIVIAVTVAAARREPLVAVTIALTALVLASPAINPWYVAWLVPLAAAQRQIPLLVLSVTVLLSYSRFVLGDLPVWIVVVEFAIPLGTVVALQLRASKRRQPAETTEIS